MIIGTIFNFEIVNFRFLDRDVPRSPSYDVYISLLIRFARVHAREPLYSNSAVIAWCSQSTGAQNILFRFTVIHSMSQYFTAFNFHDVFFLLELLFRYCSPFWPNKSL